MKKIMLLFIIFNVSNVYANVTDNNNGNGGDILIHSGKNNGANSVGTWVNPNDVPGLKGEQGEKGDQGVSGNDGKDIDPAIINNFQTGLNNQSGQLNQLDSRISELERTQYIIGGEIRLQDSQKWSTRVFADYSTTRETFDRVGIKFTCKMGKSYEEQRIEELERKINALTK